MRRPLFYRIWILAPLITLTAVYPFSGYGANSSGARAALCKTIFTNTSGPSRSIPYAKASDAPDILMKNAVDLGHKIHNIAGKENRVPEAELQALAEIYYQLNDYHSSAFVLKLIGRHDLAKNIESLTKISDPLSVTDFNIARDTKPSQTPQQLSEFFRIHGGWIKEFLALGRQDLAQAVALRVANKYLIEAQPMQAIWSLRKVGLHEKAQEIEMQINDFLRNSTDFTNDSLAGGTTEGKQLLRFGNGIRAVFRSFHPYAPVVAYGIDRLLELNIAPLAIPYELGGVKGTLQIHMNGIVKGGNNFKEERYTREDIFTLDYLLQDKDRHGDNWGTIPGGGNVVYDFSHSVIPGYPRYFEIPTKSGLLNGMTVSPEIADKVREKITPKNLEDTIEDVPKKKEFIAFIMLQKKKYLKSMTED